MTITARAFALVLLTIVCAAPAAGQTLCAVEADEFSGSRSIMCDYDDIAVETHPDHRISIARTMMVNVDNQTLFVVGAKAESWNFLNVGAIYALIDGERFEWNAEKVSSETKGRGVFEAYGAFINARELERLANANTVRVKMGTAVFDLSNSTIQQQAREVSQMR